MNSFICSAMRACSLAALTVAPPAATPDPITNWFVVDDLITDAGSPAPTQQAGAVLVSGEYYVVGGNSGVAGDTDAVWRLPISGVATGPSVAETALPADDFVYISDSTVATDSHIYVAGGGWNSAVPTLWDRVHFNEIQPDGSLDPGGWSASSVFPNGYVHQLGSAVIPANGHLYVFGGQDDSTSTFYSDCHYAEILGDGTLGSWQTGSDLPQATWFTGSTTVGNFIITAGGTPSGGSGALDEIWVCEVNTDGTMGPWTVQTEVLPEARYGTKLVAVENDILAIGGRSSAGGTNSQSNVWRATFDPDTGTVGAWSTVDAQLPAPLHYHDALYSPEEERVYVFAARSEGTLLNQLFASTLLFIPPTTAAQGWQRYR